MGNKFDRLFRAQALVEKTVAAAIEKNQIPVDKRIQQIKTLQERLDKIDYSTSATASTRKPVLGL